MTETTRDRKSKLTALLGFAVLFAMTLVIEEYRRSWLGLFNGAESRDATTRQTVAEPQTTSVAYIQAERLNVRDHPNQSGVRVAVLSRGMQVDILSTSGDWRLVRNAGAREPLGWVHVNYITTSLPARGSSDGSLGRSGQADTRVPVKDSALSDSVYNRTTQAVAAADSGRWSQVAELVEQGINVDAYVTVRYDDAGNARKGPLLLAAVSDFDDVPPEQRSYREQVAKLLMSQGALVNATDDIGTTPLHWAVKPELVEELLELGAYADARDIRGATPLHSAAVQKESAEKIRQLIAHHADINAQTGDGETPLSIAVTMRNLETVKLLVQHGANVNQPGPRGKTPLALAGKGSEIEAYLKAHGQTIGQSTRALEPPGVVGSTAEAQKETVPDGELVIGTWSGSFWSMMLPFDGAVQITNIVYGQPAGRTEYKGAGEVVCRGALRLLEGGNGEFIFEETKTEQFDACPIRGTLRLRAVDSSTMEAQWYKSGAGGKPSHKAKLHR